MTRRDAEDYVYESYLKAEKYQDRNAMDKQRRRPELSREVIRGLGGAPCVVVTGSKGKGSVSCMISQVLQTEKKVGLMTSPHLVDFCERFKINGRDISSEQFVAHMQVVSDLFRETDRQLLPSECLSPMGIQTALALSYFNQEKTEFNVFECGKGARFDDVNNVVHPYSVINTVFLEHTRELGATLAEIAADKAHVITENQKLAFVGRQKPEVLSVLAEFAASKGVPLRIYGRDFWAEKIRYSPRGMLFDGVIGTRHYKDLQVPLLGEHQAVNGVLALALCEEVLGSLDSEKVKERLAQVDWPGRMEVLPTRQFFLLDACIHAESCGAIRDVLREMGIPRVTTIVGIPDDKDYLGVVRAMADHSDHVVLTRSQNPHYLFTDRQKTTLEKAGMAVVSTVGVEEALELARSYGLPTVILGTTSVVSEVKRMQHVLNEGE